MAATQRRYSGECKAKVALAAIRGERTMNEWAGEYGVHPAQIAQGKKIAQEELPGVFTGAAERHRRRGTEGGTGPADRSAQSGTGRGEKSWTGGLSGSGSGSNPGMSR